MSLKNTSIKLDPDQLAWLQARGNVSLQLRRLVRAAMDTAAADADRSMRLRANIAARKSMLADCPVGDTLRAAHLEKELAELQSELDSREGR